MSESSKPQSRRKFLANLGLSVGAIAVAKNVVGAIPLSMPPQKKESLMFQTPVDTPVEKIDFRYAPASWQSTFCFPDDPSKGLVGREGEMLYGHPGLGAAIDAFAQTVSVGLKGKGAGTFTSQKLESPAIPIITTELTSGDVVLELVAFATNDEDEGRVDNLLVRIRPAGAAPAECTPELVVKSAVPLTSGSENDSSSSRDQIGIVSLSTDLRHPFLIVDSPVQDTEESGVHRYQLQGGTAEPNKPLTYFIRFPQAGQELDKVKDGLERQEKLLAGARKFWQEWKPTEGSVGWNIEEPYRDFFTASVRNIVEARTVKNGKKAFQVGPTVYRGLWVVDGTFLIEAARFLGMDKEAQQGLESIWDLQNKDGSIFAGAGEAHWKDTAVAIWALIRQGELSGDWEYFKELYPDAFKGMTYLRDLRNNAFQNGTSNGTYGLLPRGFGDSGIGGVRSEFTNTIWTLVALKLFLETSQRLGMPRVSDIRTFYGELRAAFFAAARVEMRKHPKGFSFLPMLMKEDPGWSETDPLKQPKFQAAQIYLSQAIFPGLLFVPDDPIVKGHLDLMKAVIQEDIPAETGWLSNDAVWTYNAPVAAQVFLWAGMPDVARKIFIGFLNHASPLYAWREEQSLHDAPTPRFIGDMPHNWASAECIRYLRSMMIMEDDKKLRLLDGLGSAEVLARIPISLVSSPTRWGRVSVTLEPIDDRHWRTTYKREGYDPKTMPPIEYVEMPLMLPGTVGFKDAPGVKVIKYGYRVMIPADAMSWEATWIKL